MRPEPLTRRMLEPGNQRHADSLLSVCGGTVGQDCWLVNVVEAMLI